MSALLLVRDVSFAYPGLRVLDSIQFTAEGGERMRADNRVLMPCSLFPGGVLLAGCGTLGDWCSLPRNCRPAQ
jgi:hypothetical protein